MSNQGGVSRRGFLAASSAALVAQRARGAEAVPVGLELYSVRTELAKDLLGTVRAVGQMGYQVVEFYAPYMEWTAADARQVRALLDELGVRCHSAHTSASVFGGDTFKKAIELNQIIGSKYIVMSSAGNVETLDGWKTVAATLTQASEQLKPLGMMTGYHNHRLEFQRIEGKLPMEVLAANTPHDVMLQLDVGTCVEAGADPVAWIRANPGRIRAIHCKDWAPGEGMGYRVLFGEGAAPWGRIFEAAESVGGVEYYLIEQEGSRFSEFETARRCLEGWRKLRG